MTRLHTPVCKLFGIDVPIFQAGMSRYTTAELVAAVSNAGGLGIIGGLNRTPDELRSEIRRVRELTSRPFGVNHVVCQLDPAAVQVTLAQRVPVLSLAWGRATDLTYQAHEAGSKVLHMVTTPEEAGLVASDGADVIVAQGTEGGVVGDVPVVAAGGIADGRGLAAVLMLGAQGALMGTRFLATPEAKGQGHSKDVILNALGSQTVASKFFDEVLEQVWPGAMVRSIKHALLDEWGDRPKEWALEDHLRQALEGALAAGDFVLAGESAGLVHDMVPAGELVHRIARQAKLLLAPDQGPPLT
jgi:NAD(P)H-dependent flavin oxidoreductase YrpB (nitropropane dioxygenase family)